VKRFFRGILTELRELVGKRTLWTMFAVAIFVVIVAWMGAHTDPRSHLPCRQPGDTEIILFFLALPILVGATIFGLGEAHQWGLLRQRRPRLARNHALRAVLFLGLAIGIGLGAAYGFALLCG
jgi:hypothetical protein